MGTGKLLPMSTLLVAIDPGVNGGIVTLRQHAEAEFPTIDCHKMPGTEFGVCKLMADISTQAREVVLYLEEPPVYAGRNLPGYSIGKLMFNTGILYGAAIAMGMQVHRVRPQAWQKAHPVGTKGDLSTTAWKNKLKARAGELFPDIDVTLWNADALLLLDAARRKAIA